MIFMFCFFDLFSYFVLFMCFICLLCFVSRYLYLLFVILYLFFVVFFICFMCLFFVFYKKMKHPPSSLGESQSSRRRTTALDPLLCNCGVAAQRVAKKQGQASAATLSRPAAPYSPVLCAEPP